jgi:hypothetical protein
MSPGVRLVGPRGPGRLPPPPIELPLDFVARKLGRTVSAAEVRAILGGLEFGVADRAPVVFSVSVPCGAPPGTFRFLTTWWNSGPLAGYDSITPAAPLVLTDVPPGNDERRFERFATDLFIDLASPVSPTIRF